METHVKVLGYLYIAFSILTALFAVLILGILILSGAISGDRTAFAITTIVGVVVSVFLLVLALPGLFAGIGLLRFRSWGRILAIVVAVLNIFNVPLGTAMGIYTLVVMFDERTAHLFEA